jgi:hypothetical protein
MAGFSQFGDVVDFFPCPGRCPDACRYAYQRIGTVEVGNFINELTAFPAWLSRRGKDKIVGEFI